MSLLILNFFSATLLRMYECPPDENYRVVGCSLIQLLGQGQTLLSKLRFVPVGVRHEEHPRLHLTSGIGDRRQQLRHGANMGKINTRAAAFVMEMIVSKARTNEMTFQIHDLRAGPDVLPHVRTGPSRNKVIGTNGEALYKAIFSVRSVNLSIDEDGICLTSGSGYCVCTATAMQLNKNVTPPLNSRTSFFTGCLPILLLHIYYIRLYCLGEICRRSLSTIRSHRSVMTPANSASLLPKCR